MRFSQVESLPDVLGLAPVSWFMISMSSILLLRMTSVTPGSLEVSLEVSDMVR
jgi:hypothetical protein